ncbi:MAG: sn-glycerol-3-phosphate ABC transporter ATP-binding protein UgpC [Oscillospiraceae bacterium]|nr:sn-glycerol-3-phosphate ABC transporter ATP-binding protein UgpC [Oscillospiraceae bacterium]
MAGITLKGINKIYPGNIKAVDDFNLEIEDKEFIILVGPSGCGKTTTLRMIAGLEEITEGELYIGGRLVNSVAPKNRDIAMVFQNYALYPHMTVYKNMAFALKLRKTPKEKIAKQVTEAAQMLDIKELLSRKPKQLSGGERQRVALGRAMVRNPAVFLLDEPLSNLDAKLRATMRAELIKLQKRLGTTFVYVTHDQAEAMTMGDRIVVMHDGLIQQVDEPQQLYDYPRNIFVAGFIGSPPMNFMDCVVRKSGGGYVARVDQTDVPILPERFRDEKITPYENKDMILGIRPEDIHLEDEYQDKPGAVALDAKVDIAEMLGSEILLYAALGGRILIAKISAKYKSLGPGDDIKLEIDCGKIHLFDKESGLTIDN